MQFCCRTRPGRRQPAAEQPLLLLHPGPLTAHQPSPTARRDHHRGGAALGVCSQVALAGPLCVAAAVVAPLAAVVPLPLAIPVIVPRAALPLPVPLRPAQAPAGAQGAGSGAGQGSAGERRRDGRWGCNGCMGVPAPAATSCCGLHACARILPQLAGCGSGAAGRLQGGRGHAPVPVCSAIRRAPLALTAAILLWPLPLPASTNNTQGQLNQVSRLQEGAL